MWYEAFRIEFSCECGGQCVVVHTPDASSIAHSLPYCEEFEQMSPDEFLRRNRERIAKGEN